MRQAGLQAVAHTVGGRAGLRHVEAETAREVQHAPAVRDAHHPVHAVGLDGRPHADLGRIGQRGEMSASQPGDHPLTNPARRLVLEEQDLKRGDKEGWTNDDRRRPEQAQRPQGGEAGQQGEAENGQHPHHAAQFQTQHPAVIFLGGVGSRLMDRLVRIHGWSVREP